MRLPCAWPTSQTAAISASVITVWCARAWGMNSSPDGLIFSVSTPSRTISRDILRNSSAPSQITAKVSRCMCIRRTSPRPDVTVISGLAASVRGPGKSPALMALRNTTSSLGLAAAALLQAVNPWSSIFLAFLTVRRMCSSGGTNPNPSRSGVSRKDRWECDSIKPGIKVAPPPSTTRAPSGGIVEPCGATALMRFPSTNTWPANGGAPLQSSTLTFLNRTLAMMFLLTVIQIVAAVGSEKMHLILLERKPYRRIDTQFHAGGYGGFDQATPCPQGYDFLHPLILYPMDPRFNCFVHP